MTGNPPPHSLPIKIQVCKESRSGGLARPGAMEKYDLSTNFGQDWLLLHYCGGASARAVLRGCLNGNYQAVLGPVLLAEYEGFLSRNESFTNSVLSAKERIEVFDGFLNRCQWVEVF